MVDRFLKVLADSLQVPVQPLSLECEWSRTAPDGLRNTSLSKYLDMVRIDVLSGRGRGDHLRSKADTI